MPETLFLIKFRPQPATLLKKRLWHRCFPVNFVKFLRTLFLQNTSSGYFYLSLFILDCDFSCGEEDEPVCGSDNKMYPNHCKMELQSCKSGQIITASQKERCLKGRKVSTNFQQVKILVVWLVLFYL